MKTTLTQKFIRLAAGLVLVVLILWGAFAIVLEQAKSWGATPAETAAVYPGDERLPHPVLNWTNAVTINAPVEQVWPWIAQMGEGRGAYYSYLFIENLIVPGGKYRNTNQILPEYQNPQPGDVMIGGLLKVREVAPQSYLLADSSTDLGWNWLWQLTPTGDGRTRMVVKIVIQTPDGAGDNPLMGNAIGLGAFVMQRKMIDGIRLRAEGGAEPGYVQPLEIGLWVLALLAGLAGAALFVLRPGWQKPLLVGAAAVIVLVLLTFVQPPLLVRAGLDVLLLAGMAWAGQRRGSQTGS